MLAFGVEAVVPFEIGAQSPRVQGYDKQGNNEIMWEELDLLEEIRDTTEIRNYSYQQAMTKYHNSKA